MELPILDCIVKLVDWANNPKSGLSESDKNSIILHSNKILEILPKPKSISGTVQAKVPLPVFNQG